MITAYNRYNSYFHVLLFAVCIVAVQIQILVVGIEFIKSIVSIAVDFQNGGIFS